MLRMFRLYNILIPGNKEKSEKLINYVYMHALVRIHVCM